MKRLLALLPLVLGLLAAGAILLWPARPLWRAPAGMALGFSADGARLHVLRGMPKVYTPPAATLNASVFAHDTKFGAAVRKFPLPRSNPALPSVLASRLFTQVRFAKDGESLELIAHWAGVGTGEGPPPDALVQINLLSGRVRIFENYEAGRRRQVVALSPLGRWAIVLRGEDEPNGPTRIMDVDSFQLVAALPPRSADALGVDLGFSADESELVIAERYLPKRPASRPVRTRLLLLALPAGAETRRLDLDGDLKPVAWAGSKLWLEERVPARIDGQSAWRTQLACVDQGAKPEKLTTFPWDFGHSLHPHREELGWTIGPDAVAVVRDEQRETSPFMQKVAEWAAKVGWVLDFDGCRINLTVRRLSDGALLAQQDLPGSRAVVSPDLRFIAIENARRDTLEVWPAQPSPRWPWALATTGLGAVSTVLMWRRKGPRLAG